MKNKQPQSAAASPPPPPGVVKAGEVYRLREFLRRLGWREHALRQARAAGLELIIFGREKFVMGDDAIAFFRGLKQKCPRAHLGSSAEGHELDQS